MSELPINQVVCGDCIEVMQKFPKKSVDMILTDPPYSTPVITAFGRKNEKNYGDLSIQRNFFRIFKEILQRILKQKSAIFIFCNSKYYPILFEVFYKWTTQHLLIWDKTRIGMGRPFRSQYELIYFLSPNSRAYFRDSGLSDILRYKPCSLNNKLVGSQKPIALIRRLIQDFTRKGDVVLDPFVGSGTTCIAANQLDRRWIGIEINPEYYEIAKQRVIKECSQRLTKWA